MSPPATPPFGVDGSAPGNDAGTDAATVTDQCVPPTGTGTKHGDGPLTADAVWKAADGPHVVTLGFTVEAAATLTIEPCAKVMFDGANGGYGITVLDLASDVSNDTTLREARATTVDDAAVRALYGVSFDVEKGESVASPARPGRENRR